VIEKALSAHVGHALKTTRYTNGSAVLEIFCETCNKVIFNLPEDGVCSKTIREETSTAEGTPGTLFGVEVKIHREVGIVGGFSPEHAAWYISQGVSPDVSLGCYLLTDFSYDLTELLSIDNEVCEFGTVLDAKLPFTRLKEAIIKSSLRTNPLAGHVDHDFSMGAGGGMLDSGCGMTLFPGAYEGILTEIEISYGAIDASMQVDPVFEKIKFNASFTPCDSLDDAIDRLRICCITCFLVDNFDFVC